MKIAYVGNFEPPYSTENDVRKAYEHLGHGVIKIQENQPNQLVQMKSYEYDMLLITGTWDWSSEMLSEFISTVQECAKRGIPTATLHLDTFWGTSRGGRKWWLHPMFHTAYIFSADGDYDKEWKLFGKNHLWLPPAVRRDATELGTYKDEYACDVAFVGSNGNGYHEDVWGYRKELIAAIKDICIRNNWSFRNPGGDESKIERDHRMNDFYASAKLTIGDSLCLKKEKSLYFSDRVFEATGRGGLLLMPQIDILDKMFSNRLPMYRWGDWVDLEVQMTDLMGNKSKRQEIVNFTHDIANKHHTYVNRVEHMLKVIYA